MSFIAELKRRSVFKVAVTYGIVSWLLIEVSATVLPIFEAPFWIVQVFTFFILLGFPIALVLSWAYDLTPHGIERTEARSDADGETGGQPADGSRPKPTVLKIEYAVIGVLAFALLFMLVNRYTDIYDNGPDAAVTGPATVDVMDAMDAEEAAGVLPNSVAVLPFDNLSPDPDNAYFAAGIHEEVLNQLVKLSGLNVIARTSMMQFSDGTRSIPEIAQELNVETVMEGSVRYAEDRVLVTAQLIDAETNVHIWSESYNRELVDIFTIQSDIAMSIASALEAEFSTEEQEQMAHQPTESAEAYALYLQAKQEIAGPGVARALNRAIELDPEFALAFATKAWSTSLYFRYIASDDAAEDAIRSIREDAGRALELDPTLGIAHVALALLDESLWRADAARAGYRRALDLSPQDPQIMIWFASLLANLDEFDMALRMARRAVQLDPSNFLSQVLFSNILLSAGRFERAYDVARTAAELAPTEVGPHVLVAITAERLGNSEAAIESLKLAEQLEARASQYQLARSALVYSQANRPDEAQRIFNLLGERDVDSRPNSIASPAAWIIAYLAIDETEEALARLNEAIDQDQPGDFTLLNEIRINFFGHPVLEEDPRFVATRARLQFDR